MCWGVPAKIIDIKDNMATVDIAGVKKYIALDLIENANVDDYVLVHAGYAIEKVNEENAKFTLDFFKL